MGKDSHQSCPGVTRVHRATCFFPNTQEKAQPQHPGAAVHPATRLFLVGGGAWSVCLKSAAVGGRLMEQGERPQEDKDCYSRESSGQG